MKKTDKYNRVNVIADLKGDQLGSHGGADVGAENNGNCLGKAHQACAYKSDDHDGGGGAALQDRGDQRAGQGAHDRVSGQEAQDAFFIFPPAVFCSASLMLFIP